LGGGILAYMRNDYLARPPSGALMQSTRSVWAARFIGLTFVLGGVAWVIITILVLGNVLAGMNNFVLGPASSRIVAGGGAGSWFVMGMLSYLVIGIVGLGLSALFYQHLEVTLGAPLKGWRNLGAWAHLTLGGIGAAATSLLMAWGGFQAGAAGIATNLGGGGRDAAYIHANILQPIVNPIAILMGVALLGYFIGGIVLTTAWMTTRRK